MPSSRRKSLRARSAWVTTADCRAVPPPPSGAWTFCSAECEQCAFSGTKEVRSGANGTFTAPRVFSNGVYCSNEIFGDPLPGVPSARIPDFGGTPPPPDETPAAPPADQTPPSEPSGLAGKRRDRDERVADVELLDRRRRRRGVRRLQERDEDGVGHLDVLDPGGLDCGTSYWFGVEALDAAGNRSSRARVNASTSACPPPPSEWLDVLFQRIRAVHLLRHEGSPLRRQRHVHGAARLLERRLVYATTSSATRSTASPSAVSTETSAERLRRRLTIRLPTSSALPAHEPRRRQRHEDERLADLESLDRQRRGHGLRRLRQRHQRPDPTQPGATVSLSPAAPPSRSRSTRSTRPATARRRRGSPPRPPPAPDTQAPTAPTNVAASSRTATSIALTWSASTDNVGVTGYGLYRGGTLVGTASTTTGIFSGLTCNTNYTLAVDA